VALTANHFNGLAQLDDSQDSCPLKFCRNYPQRFPYGTSRGRDIKLSTN